MVSLSVIVLDCTVMHEELKTRLSRSSTPREAYQVSGLICIADIVSDDMIA